MEGLLVGLMDDMVLLGSCGHGRDVVGKANREVEESAGCHLVWCLSGGLAAGCCSLAFRTCPFSSFVRLLHLVSPLERGRLSSHPWPPRLNQLTLFP